MTTPTARKFEPTTARGAEHAAEVLAHIEAELDHERATWEAGHSDGRPRGYRPPDEGDTEAGAWDQAHWGRVQVTNEASRAAVTELRAEPYSGRAGDLVGRAGGPTVERDFLVDPAVEGCSTSFCFAGWTSALVGDLFVNRVIWSADTALGGGAKAGSRNVFGLGIETVIPVENADRVRDEWTEDSWYTDTRSVSTRACDLLDIDRTEGDVLFDGHNTLARLRELVGKLVEGEHLVPWCEATGGPSEFCAEDDCSCPG